LPSVFVALRLAIHSVRGLGTLCPLLPALPFVEVITSFPYEVSVNDYTPHNRRILSE
jgi:hypothetical protein